MPKATNKRPQRQRKPPCRYTTEQSPSTFSEPDEQPAGTMNHTAAPQPLVSGMVMEQAPTATSTSMAASQSARPGPLSVPVLTPTEPATPASAPQTNTGLPQAIPQPPQTVPPVTITPQVPAAQWSQTVPPMTMSMQVPWTGYINPWMHPVPTPPGFLQMPSSSAVPSSQPPPNAPPSFMQVPQATGQPWPWWPQTWPTPVQVQPGQVAAPHPGSAPPLASATTASATVPQPLAPTVPSTSSLAFPPPNGEFNPYSSGPVQHGDVTLTALTLPLFLPQYHQVQQDWVPQSS